MDSCIFCKIIRGELPCYKVWEDEKYLAFLTISPHQRGHTLVIPKEHTDYLFDLDETTLSEIFTRTKPLAQALRETFAPKTDKVGVVVAGMGVPHVHIHLIPMDSESDLDFANARHNVPQEELTQNAEKIKENLEI